MKQNLGNAPLHIGGWLILIGIRLVGGIAANGNSIMQTISLHVSATGQITRILFILAILYVFFVLYLFYKRHKAFPGVYIGLESFSIITNLSMFFISYKPNTTLWEAFWLPYTVVLPLISILWIIYMLLSKRVKKTFVFKWDRTADQRLIDKANALS